MNLDNSYMSQKSKNKALLDFSNEFNINISSILIFPPTKECFIQISPDDNYMAIAKNNSLLEIYIKENNNWVKNFDLNLFPSEKKKIKDINWSKDSSMLLIYGYDIDRKSFIKAINKNGRDWTCNIEIRGYINHASFYPDSKSIIYIKSPINSLNIFSLLKDKLKNQYFGLKFDDERSINYITNNNNIFMILPCYGRTSFEKKNNITNNPPKDCLVILANKEVFKFVPLFTIDLDRIVPLNNRYSFFIVIEKEFYKLPFYIYNLKGEIMFKSNAHNNITKNLRNPCLLYNENFVTNFILVQEPEGILEILGCETLISLSKIYFYYNYKKLYEINNNTIINCDSKNIYSDDNNYIEKEFSYFNKDDILFLEEKKINKNGGNYINGQNNEENVFKKNKKIIKLIKVNYFNIDTCYDENEFLLHAEISPLKNYICFINKKYPNYLFFGNYYQSGVFKIIKFMKNILEFKWSNIEDILLVTLDSSIFYLITKDYYINYELDKNYQFNNIKWSSSGKEVILSNEEKQIRMVAIFY